MIQSHQDTELIINIEDCSYNKITQNEITDRSNIYNAIKIIGCNYLYFVFYQIYGKIKQGDSVKKTFLYSLGWVILDQGIKTLITIFLKLGESIQILSPFLSITYVRNTGAAWSIFEGNRIFLIMISLLALFILYKFLRKGPVTALSSFGYGILIGGIIGNLWDRLIHGYVIDFISVHIGSYAFPVFNIADIGIVIGACIIIYILYKEEQNEKRSAK